MPSPNPTKYRRHDRPCRFASDLYNPNITAPHRTTRRSYTFRTWPQILACNLRRFCCKLIIKCFMEKPELMAARQLQRASRDSRSWTRSAQVSSSSIRSPAGFAFLYRSIQGAMATGQKRRSHLAGRGASYGQYVLALHLHRQDRQQKLPNHPHQLNMSHIARNTRLSPDSTASERSTKTFVSKTPLLRP